jgi:hypothetical protein
VSKRKLPRLGSMCSTARERNGSVKFAIADITEHYFEGDEDPDSDEVNDKYPAQRRGDYAEYLLEQLQEFIAFLATCGGCTSK